MISQILTCVTLSAVLSAYSVYGAEGVRYQISPHPDYLATWEIANGTIDFVAAVRTTGWVGLAVNYQPKMSGADIMFGGIDHYGGRGTYIYNYGAQGLTLTPKPYSYWTQGSVPFSETDGITTVSFRRPLNTPEPGGIAILDTDMYFCWAIGQTDDNTMKHRSGHNGAIRINLMNPQTQQQEQPQPQQQPSYSYSPYY